MKTLIIAEKPSVARDLASALGRVKKEGDHFENDELVISSAVGHLCELFMPDDIDPKLKSWTLKTLPIIPDKFQLKPIEKTADQFKLLKKLIARKDVSLVINACDAGREGELIFRYLYDLAGGKKPVKRMWMQSMTQDGIRQAWQALKDDNELQPLGDAARCRSEADWLVGINGTRAVTLRLFGRRQVATVGRVQTPTLALVVERDREIRAFVPTAYWRVVGQFGLAAGTYEGVYQRPDFKKGGDDGHDRADRLWDQARAEAVARAVRAAAKGTVKDEVKRTREQPPRLYDLTTLQREANGRFGLPASRTLSIAQALYEKFKVLTYPRTDSRALPEDYLGHVHGVLRNLEGELAPHAGLVVEKGWIKPNKRIFNNAEVSDHFAIIPTGESPAKLEGLEAKVYDMVARRFIAVFYPAAEFDVTTRTTTVAEHAFRTEGKVLVVPGWRAVYGRDDQEAGVIPPTGKADGQPPTARVEAVDVIGEATKPPARFTEATLLTAMETAGKLVDDEELAAAMKEKGLGTPATRASTIEHLVNEKYIERDRRDLRSTPKAEELIDFLNLLDAAILTKPALTGEWEHQLRQVEERRATRADFMQGIRALATDLVQKVRGFEEANVPTKTVDLASPTDGQPLKETMRAWESQDGVLRVYKVIGNRKMELPEVAELLAKKRLGPLDGFRSKAGKPYSAVLRLNAEHKVEFDFGPRGGEGSAEGETGADGANLADAPTIGPCPKACQPGAVVKAYPNAFACECQARGDKGCDFRLGRQMLSKALPEEEVAKLLAEKKTGLIKGFISNKTRRPFDAFLTLKEGGKIGFEFPPRAPKAAAGAGGGKGRGGKFGARGAKAAKPAAGDGTGTPAAIPDEPF